GGARQRPSFTISSRIPPRRRTSPPRAPRLWRRSSRLWPRTTGARSFFRSRASTAQPNRIHPPMRVYLMRHATAEDPVTGPDSGRRLTEQGRREAREAGKSLLERGAAPAAILTSPRLRARETAELVAAELGG